MDEAREILRIQNEGEALARELEAASSLDELLNLEPEIATFADYVDGHFGEEATDGEMESDLSLALYIALDWKKAALERSDDAETAKLFASYLADYRECLRDGGWREHKY